MAIHHPGSRAGTGVALKAIREAVMHGSGKGIFATLNVVPMIDLFTMLVIFLIQQYSASGELTLVNPNVALPKAGASAELQRAPMIGLTRSDANSQGDLLFENQRIMSLADINEVKFPSWDIKPLADVLKRTWAMQQQNAKNKKDKDNRKVIIQLTARCRSRSSRWSWRRAAATNTVSPTSPSWSMPRATKAQPAHREDARPTDAFLSVGGFACLLATSPDSAHDARRFWPADCVGMLGGR